MVFFFLAVPRCALLFYGLWFLSYLHFFCACILVVVHSRSFAFVDIYGLGNMISGLLQLHTRKPLSMGKSGGVPVKALSLNIPA